jgi:septum formation topological specificity factor MinE
MSKEEINKEILELKSKKVMTQKDKLRVQLLQQELSKFD